MKVTEDNYVDLLKKHNEKALNYFIDQHGWIIKSIICKQLQNYPDGHEEIMNDVFLAIWNHCNRYNKEKGSFLTWVGAITKYKIITYLRKQSTQLYYEVFDNLEQVSPHVVPHAQTDMEMEEQQQFYELIKCLKKDDQELFIKRFMEEKDNDEISKEMGVKKDIIYNRLSRGKQKIKRYMEGRTSS